MAESSMDFHLFAQLLNQNLQILDLNCSNIHIFGSDRQKDNVLRVIFKGFCGYQLKLSNCHFKYLDKEALKSQEWGCMKTLQTFKLKDVQSGFTSDIAEIIIDKLVEMP